MDIKVQNQIAIIHSSDILLKDTQSALDFVMDIQYETGCSKIALNKEAILEDFFKLSTCIAGEILQKFVNYKIKFAIVGDFSKYTSKALNDFIYECNNSNDILFVSSNEEAIKKLSK